MGLWLMEKVEQTIRTSNQDMLVTLVLIRTDLVAPILHIPESRVTRTGGMILLLVTSLMSVSVGLLRLQSSPG